MSYVPTPPGDFVIPTSAPTPSRVNIQAIMRLVYVWMGLGLLTTAIVAYFTASNEDLFMLTLEPAVRIGSIIGTFVLVIAISTGIHSKWLSANMAMILFFVYAALMGLLLSIILVAFEMSDIIPAYGTTVILFGVMSVFGYTTSMDLTKWGTYLMMGLVALIIVSFANLLFFGGNGLWLSIFGVFIFTGLTAYDTQKIKNFAESYEIQSDANLALKFSIYGALELYLDFVNLFLYLLRIFASRD